MNKVIINPNGTELTLDVEFLDNPTAKKILESLPIESEAQTWGDEIYFDTGILAPVENETMNVEVGDIAYWPTGKCLCIFFGRTPASSGEKPAPASEVVVVGTTSAKPADLRKVPSGAKITVK